MEAKKLCLTNQQVKVLADLIQQPKVKGFNQQGQAITEGISPDTARKIQKRRDALINIIKPYLNLYDNITDRYEIELEATELDPDDSRKEDLERALAKRHWLVIQQNRELEQLMDTNGRGTTAILLSDDDLDFIISRFDGREDLTVSGDMLDIIVTISDALGAARKSDAVPLQEAVPTPNGGSKVLHLVPLGDKRGSDSTINP